MNSADANCFGLNRWDTDFTEADAEETRIAMKDTVVVTVRERKTVVTIVDPTHVTLRFPGGPTGWAYHVAQLDDEMVRELQKTGRMDARRYVK
jgi:hypothetical protein